jgi:hypothetical protein
MPRSPSSYVTRLGTSFSQRAMMPSCDVTSSYPQTSRPATEYGYHSPSAEAQQPLYDYQPASDRQPTSYNQWAVQPVQPYGEVYPQPQPPPPPSMADLGNQMADLTMGHGVGPSGGVVFTEQRGIHIRELSRRASEEQIRRMICEAAGREASLINVVDVPLDKEGSPRGHAIVHFRSAALARRMETRLHGADFKGKKLQVRLLKEGEVVGIGCCNAVASPPTRSHGHGHRSGRHYISSSRRDEGRRRDRDREGWIESVEKKVSSTSLTSQSMPLAVGGGRPVAEASSALTPSSSPKIKDREKDKHSGKKSAVVIADGSSRRADKKS